MISSRSFSGSASTLSSPMSAPLLLPSNSHNGRSSQRPYQYQWTFSHSVLASLIVVLNFQIIARNWFAAHCQIPAAPVVAVTASSSSNGGGTDTSSSNLRRVESPVQPQTMNNNSDDNIATSSQETTTTAVAAARSESTSALVVDANSNKGHEIRGATVDNSSPSTAKDAESIATAPVARPPKVIQWEGLDAMRMFAQTYFNGTNVVCDRIGQERQDAQDDQLPLTIDISFGCNELFHQSGYGTGNYISFVYGLRLATAVHTNVGLNLTCHDANDKKSHLILPWLMGYFPPRSVESHNPYPDVSLEQACAPYRYTQISRLYRDMQVDFRRMAVGLVGLPRNENHPAHVFAREQRLNVNDATDASKASTTGALVRPRMQLAVDVNRPVFAPPSELQLDDVVLHFRCGDLMDSTHPNFAFLRFASYVQDISPTAQSIGIITQPFPKTNKKEDASSGNEKGQARSFDASRTTQDRCRTVVHALVGYIQERHLHARVTIHNGPSETIALAYARMVMANQTIAGISTFGVFPVLSSFGTGYLHQPQGPFVNGWMFSPVQIDELASNVRIVRDVQRHIMVADLKQKWETEGAAGVVKWFTTE